ncbi:tetratricopeptide repeat protein [Thiohalocapsa sp. ML1]|uniref:tetratricopeptide repeat protein n=1 Tax=Thiohalocapsa sp. ML1 TaxID=1431688 RepID=UPI0007322069|nr:tetratricopeptide repeat protein [Thiohalocapsa sp. ML1]
MHTHDLEGAQEAEARLVALRADAKAAGEDAFATYIEIDRLILAGWIAQARERTDGAVALIREAAEVEDSVEKHPVTPGPLLPPCEALGDLLLELGRPAKALAAYEASDQVWPGRFNTLLGAARAAEAAGDDDAAQAWFAELVEVAEDSDRAAVPPCRRAAVPPCPRGGGGTLSRWSVRPLVLDLRTFPRAAWEDRARNNAAGHPARP